MKENRRLVVVVGVLFVAGLVIAAVLAAFFISKAGPTLLGRISSISIGESSGSGKGEIKFDSNKTIKIEQEIGEVKSLGVNVAINKGSVEIRESVKGDMIEGSVGYFGDKPDIKMSGSGDGGLTLAIKSEDKAGESVSLNLVPKVRSVVNLGVGMGDVRANLGKLNVSSINVAVGTGNTEVTFSGANSTTASVATGAGNVKLKIPKGVEHKIVYRETVKKNEVLPGVDYVVEGNLAKTRGYDLAKVRLTVNVAVGAGKISLESY